MTERSDSRLRKLQEHDVAIYLRVKGRDTREVDELIYKFCQDVKKKLGRRLVLRGAETDK